MWRLTAAECSRCWATPRVAPHGAWMSLEARATPRPPSACQRTWAPFEMDKEMGKSHGKAMENPWKLWHFPDSTMKKLGFKMTAADLTIFSSKLPGSIGLVLLGRSIHICV